MKRVISLVVISTFLFTFLLVGCGAKDSASTTTSVAETEQAASTSTQTTEKKLEGKITFATNRTDMAETTLKDLANKFTQKYPGVQVEIEGIKDTDSIIVTRISAGEIPDICPIPGSVAVKDFPLYFAPLDDLGFSTDNLHYYSKGVSADNKLYAVNSAIGMDGVVYNKKVFKDCGIDKIPATLDELYAACEKIKAKGIVPMATNFKDAWPLYWWTFNFAKVNSGNTNYINELANKDDYISAGGMLDALQVFKTFVDKGYTEKDLVSTNWDGCKKDLALGKTAMFFENTGYPSQVIDNGGKQEDIGMFPFPFPNNKGILLGSDWLFGIGKDSKNMEAAKEFLKFLFLEGNGNYASSTGNISSLKTAKLDNVFVNELLSYGVPTVEQPGDSADFGAIRNAAQFECINVAQEYALSKNPDEVVKKYNEKWAAARKSLNK